MKHLKYLLLVFIGIVIFWACDNTPIKQEAKNKENPVIIKNDTLEYEIIIIDPGFTAYLNSIARPEGFYSQSYLENWNQIYVTNWNMRAQNPTRFNNTIYENVIDYNSFTDYGYEVNYKLFNYFQFAQRKYRINLGNSAIVRQR